MTSTSDTEFEGEHDKSFDELETRICQGDVIKFTKQEPPPPPQSALNWSAHLGVIVTANCDLAHRKHGGILSYVPLVPLNVYASLLTIPRIGESAGEGAMSRLRDSLPVGRGWPTFERLQEMLWDGRPPDQLRPYLPTDTRAEDVEKALREVDACMRWEKRHEAAHNWQEILESLADLLQDVRTARKQKPGSRAENVQSELRSRIHKSLPGDALFFSSPALSSSGGSIAYLRIIREVPLGSIAISFAQERLNRLSTIARRIGRISPLYLHRLTQQMAAVFTDIGLPTKYETHKDRKLAATFAEWTSSMRVSS